MAMGQIAFRKEKGAIAAEYTWRASLTLIYTISQLPAAALHARYQVWWTHVEGKNVHFFKRSVSFYLTSGKIQFKKNKFWQMVYTS